MPTADLKAVTPAGTHTTPTSPVAWRPDTTAYVPADVVPDALLVQTSTVVGQIEGDAPSVRVPFVSDDGQAGFIAEGTEIPDAGQGFDEVVVTTDKIATVGKYSFETLAQPEAARLIVDSLSRLITSKANIAYLQNASAPAGLLGLATAGGALGGNLDKVVDGIASIEADGGAASHVIASPSAWAAVSKLKQATGSNASLLPSGNDAGVRTLLGVPVLVSNAAPDGNLLILDRRSVIAASGPIRLARSEDAFFTSDVIAIRVTWRFGWQVMHPKRIVKLTVS
jgi:HK97 family phage major capsid protein